MSNNPVTDAFFFGRALAEVMSEKLEESFTNLMSDLGKFDAEQRENLRQFIEEVQLRADRATDTTVYPSSSNSNNGNQVNSRRSTSAYQGVNIDTSMTNAEDLQTMLDQLRAEMATLRTELKKYRN